MKSELIRRLYKRQQGFTLIEIIVGVAISSLILLVTVACIYQIFFSGYNVREDMRSIQYVQNTGSWLRLDALKSQVIVPGDNPGTGEYETMTLYWAGAARKDGGNDCLDYYEVSYYIDSEELRRKEHVTTNVYDSDGDFIGLRGAVCYGGYAVVGAVSLLVGRAGCCTCVGSAAVCV